MNGRDRNIFKIAQNGFLSIWLVSMGPWSSKTRFQKICRQRLAGKNIRDSEIRHAEYGRDAALSRLTSSFGVLRIVAHYPDRPHTSREVQKIWKTRPRKRQQHPNASHFKFLNGVPSFQCDRYVAEKDRFTSEDAMLMWFTRVCKLRNELCNTMECFKR